MNKKLAYVIILSIGIFLTGCQVKNNVVSNDGNVNNNSQVGSNEQAVEVPKYKINDYIQIKENVKYSYKGENHEYAEYVAYVDYVAGDKFQIRSNNGGTETVNVFQVKDGELIQTFKRNTCYYRENFTTKKSDSSEILLKEPLVKGTSWTLPDGGKRYISGVDVQISTPSGNYSTIEVTTEKKSGEKSLHYYAINKGLVKYVSDSDNMKITSTLQGIEEGAKLTQTVRIFYPNINVDKIHYQDKEIVFNTNDITKLILQNIFKNFPGNDEGTLFSSNVTINSLYLNDDGRVHVDLTSSFVKDMNLGSGPELMLLQSIANTLGNYYSVEEVYITIEGKPYSSGHIIKSNGEGFKVDFNGIVEGK
ncbi:MAG: GerMN domain-containing protein [Clostridium sp.]|uniref:GerMN domain-containing protein n=1 Tax=Clostridium sp. TaxID=1506 RepID=UPI00303015BC